MKTLVSFLYQKVPFFKNEPKSKSPLILFFFFLVP
nr:MAG TPA: hypothetical protein [Caudoviricetes sp.]